MAEAFAQPVLADAPLVVDLDGTLVCTDTLHESLLSIALRRPAGLLGLIKALLRGRAAFKSAVARQATLDWTALPYCDAVLELVHSWRRAGREVHLVTAADQDVANHVGDHLELFTTVEGSDGEYNLKGGSKAQRLKERFPGGFAYVGDAVADIPVWRAAREGFIVRRGDGVPARIRRHAPALTVIRTGSPVVKAWLKELRIHQWVKNAVIFVALILARRFDSPHDVETVTAGCLIFGLIASGTYVINDLADLSADRAHPTKRLRPVACGTISIAAGVSAALLLVLGGLAAAALLSPKFFVVALSYVVLTLTYSLFLKRQMMIDVVAIGGLFTIRIVAGMVLLQQPISLWLTSFTFILFTSLALAKRHAELVRMSAETGRGAAGRGYEAADAPLTVALGMATALSAIVVMLLYLELEPIHAGLYAHAKLLFLIDVSLAAWLVRIWSRAHRGTLLDDPVIFALKDRISWGYAASVGALWLAAIV